MSDVNEGAEEQTAESTDRADTDWKAEAEKWQNLARKHEERSRKDAGAAKELEKFRAAAMTETEKAVAEAKASGATEAVRAAAPRLVKAELRAAAAEAGLPKESLTGFLKYAELSRFVGEDGEVDEKAISAVIKELGGGKPADFDGGTRTPAGKATDMNSLIRRAAGVG
jgi:hypothetical protein